MLAQVERHHAVVFVIAVDARTGGKRNHLIPFVENAIDHPGKGFFIRLLSGAYNDAHYKTSVDQDAWGFVPGGDNPWKKYEPAKAWSASTVYVKGDRVVVDGQAYEALFWTQSDNPDSAGQFSTKSLETQIPVNS